jgi:hypothetical protein
MTFKPAISLTAAMNDPQLFGTVFASPTYWPWKVVAKLIDGIPLTEPREIELFIACTGRHVLPKGPVRRLVLLVGRRGGKDRFLSAVGVWRTALICDWRKYSSAGEQNVCILLGADKRQGTILSKYAGGLIAPPMIAAEVTRNVKDVVEFRNTARLEISTNDARLVRGRSAIAVLGSECCHWRTDEHAASSDEEVIGAAEPSLAMCADTGLMIMGSSVYRKKGYMFRRWKELFGNDDAEDICWFAPSATMNPRLSQAVIDKALSTDSARAKAEFLNEWRSDLSDFIPSDVIDNATDAGVYERAPLPNMTYYAHALAAGGTGKDSFAFAISHREASYVVDVVREYRPRFVPAAVIGELAQICKTYRITKFRDDKFGGGFHSSEWATHGITFEPCEGTTSENYLTLLPLLLAGRVRLPDHKTLRTQLGSLERRPGEGRETVSHPQHDSAHDDLATACAGAVVAAMPANDGSYSMEIWDRVNGNAAAEAERVLQNFAREAWGPQQPGAVDLGDHGYKAPNHWNPRTEADDRIWEAYKRSMTEKAS